MTWPEAVDSGSFRNFEHAGWQSVAHRYHDHFAALTTQVIGPLLEAVGADRGVSLLGVATGPGSP